MSLILRIANSKKLLVQKKEESKLLMSKIFSDFEKKNHNLIVDNKILNRLGVSDTETWLQLVKKIHLILPMALTYNAKTKEDRIDYTKIFNQKEIEFMSQQAVKVNSETWSDYLGIKLKKRQNNDANKTNVFTSKTYFFTTPVFTINQDYALIYQEQRYGGSLVIYQKIKGKWQAVASAMVWVS